MYDRSQFLNSSIKYLLCFLLITSSLNSIAINGTPVPVSTPSPRATNEEIHVRKTHEFARSMAKTQVNQLLLQAVLTSLRGTRSSVDMSALLKSVAIQGNELKSIVKQIQNLSFEGEDLDTYSNEVLVGVVQEFRSNLILLQNQKMFLEDFQDKAQASRNDLLQTISQMKSNFKTYCQEGVAYSPNSGLLPALQPIMPGFDVELKLALTTDANFSNIIIDKKNSIPSANSYTTSESLAASALLYALSTATAASAISGQVILTNVAFSQLSMSTQAAAYGIGLGATFVIAVAVYLYNQNQYRSQMEDAVHNMKWQFDNVASSEDFRTYFKEICQKSFEIIGPFNPDQGLQSPSLQIELTHLDEDWKSVSDFMSKYVKLLNAYQNKANEILKSLPEGASEENKKNAEKTLSMTPESIAYSDFGQTLEPLTLSRFFKTIMLKALVTNENAAKTLEEAATSELKNLAISPLEERYKTLRDFTIHKKYVSTISKNINHYFNQEQALHRFKGLASRLNILILQKTEQMVKIQCTVNEKLEIMAKFNEWISDAQKLETEMPGLGGIADLINQAQYFSKTDGPNLL